MANDLRWRVIATGMLGIIVLAAFGTGAAQPFLVLPTELTADVAAGIIRFLGVDAVQNGTVIFRPYVFACEISYGCIGILPVSALAIAMLFSPTGLGAKAIGLGIGIPLVLTINMARLVHLFVIGVEHPDYFWFAHRVAWEVAMLGSVLVIWNFWMRSNIANVEGTKDLRHASKSHERLAGSRS